MAGDWIKFELATLDKPEVLKMAEVLEVSSDDVVGKLLRVWGWFDQQSRDGYAGGVTGNALMRFIDRIVGCQGFARTMQTVGWLSENGIPNFDRHNGKPAKDRALSKDRMQKRRYADVTQDASLEKRREEKKPPISPKGDVPDWIPLEAWNGYVEMRTKIRKPLTDRAKALAIGKLTALKARGFDPTAVLDEATEHSWAGIYEPKRSAGGDDKFQGAL